MKDLPNEQPQLSAVLHHPSLAVFPTQLSLMSCSRARLVKRLFPSEVACLVRDVAAAETSLPSVSRDAFLPKMNCLKSISTEPSKHKKLPTLRFEPLGLAISKNIRLLNEKKTLTEVKTTPKSKVLKSFLRARDRTIMVYLTRHWNLLSSRREKKRYFRINLVN